MSVMILTTNNGGIKGYHGTIGTLTNMYDSNYNPLYVGDVVVCYNMQNVNTPYQSVYIEYVCEENTSIANWTNHNHQYVWGLGGFWNSDAFAEYSGVDITPTYNEDGEEIYSEDAKKLFALIDSMSEKWLIKKVKSYKEIVSKEKI